MTHMFAAQLKYKLTRSEENMEDLLTSNVFGLFEYAPAHLGLVPFLKTARNLAGQPIENLDKIHTAKYIFWPWIHEECEKGCEPDVLIWARLADESKLLFLIESKYFSGKSDSTDDSIRPKDQLAREMLNLRGLAKKETNKNIFPNFILIYVTAHTIMPRDEVKESMEELEKSNGIGLENRIYWTTWRRLPSLLEELIPMAADPLPKMFGHLKQILINANLIFFEGIHHEGWTLGQPEWRFDASPHSNSKIFNWLPGPQPGRIIWRWKHGKV